MGFQHPKSKIKIVRLLMEYHSNANNKFIDDYKTNISFEVKNETKIEYKKVFLGMFVWIAEKYHYVHTPLNTLTSGIVCPRMTEQIPFGKHCSPG